MTKRLPVLTPPFVGGTHVVVMTPTHSKGVKWEIEGAA